MGSKKKAGFHGLDFGAIIKHVRAMIATPDPLSILVRGMILVEKALDDLIDTYSAVTFASIDEHLKHPTLWQKAVLACSLGAISEGELTCIRRINKVRNDLAHRVPVDVTADDEESVVNVFKNQTKLFSGLEYDKKNFPRGFIFILLVLAYHLSMRVNRPGEEQKIRHKPDESNIEGVGAITLTVVTTKLANTPGEHNDEEIIKVLEAEADKAKALRDKHRAEEGAKSEGGTDASEEPQPQS